MYSTSRLLKAINESTLDETLKNSYKNFHSKGLSYICLAKFKQEECDKRDAYFKIYIFDGDVTKLSEVANPHDHRYDFHNKVVKGVIANRTYRENWYRKPIFMYNKFEYMTPLNGGNGFTWKEEEYLYDESVRSYNKGEEWVSRFDEIQTLQIRSDQAILEVFQGPDQLATFEPTYCYTKDKEPPSLDGLYDKFTEDELIELLEKTGYISMFYKRNFK